MYVKCNVIKKNLVAKVGNSDFARKLKNESKSILKNSMSISQNCEQSAFNVFDLPRGNISWKRFRLYYFILTNDKNE